MSTNAQQQNKMLAGMIVNLQISGNLIADITQALIANEDFNRSKTILSRIQNDVPDILKNVQALTLMGNWDGEKIIKKALADFPLTISNLAMSTRNASSQSVAGYRMTATMLAQESQIYLQKSFSNLYARILYDIPETFITNKAIEWYNKAFKQTELPPSIAITAFNRASNKYFPKQEGGYTFSKMERDENLYIHGFSDAKIKILMDMEQSYPNIRTVTRDIANSDFTDETVAWLCAMNNVTLPQLVTYYQKLMHKFRLRSEYDFYVNTYLKQAYLDGTINDDEFIAECIAHNVTQEEATQANINVAVEFDRNLMRSEVQTQTYLYRTGETLTEAMGLEDYKTLTNPAEELFYDRLDALGLDATWVNALVRLESAKKAKNWEHS